MTKQHKKKLDDLWGKIIRSKGRCELCGKMRLLQAHHFFSRIHTATRWDLDNGFCLCSGHHKFWAHRDAPEFTLWAIRKRGHNWYKLLSIKKRTICKSDYELINAYLKGWENGKEII